MISINRFLKIKINDFNIFFYILFIFLFEQVKVVLVMVVSKANYEVMFEIK